ncbi:Spo0B domain-containing protein [Paenibacillus sp. 598K]|uniref:Spo0B domain-containing protein n=1 Tax=Paenibacillus sp. 598K TaxID=1117987 RepID=UPI0021A9C443|nr:Spo0B domain-containing protein [Paenibacillus sp. 598K]
MNRLRGWKYGAAASIAVPSVAAWMGGGSSASQLLLVVWVAAAATVWIAVERKEQAQRLEQALLSARQTSLRILNHHRHDWMNELQVLYGYIRLQKPDKTVQCVERIRDRMMMESRIAKLNEPGLVLYLQSFRTVSKALQLEVLLEEEVNWMALGSDAAALGVRLTELLEAFRLGIKPGAGDAPRIQLELSQYEGIVEVSLELDGELQDAPALERRCQEVLADSRFRIVRLTPEMDCIVLQAELAAG